MIDMSRRILLASISAAAAVLLAIVLQTTTPATIHPLGIVLVFVLCYVVMLGLLTYLLAGIAALVARGAAASGDAELSALLLFWLGAGASPSAADWRALGGAWWLVRAGTGFCV